MFLTSVIFLVNAATLIDIHTMLSLRVAALYVLKGLGENKKFVATDEKSYLKSTK